MSQQPEQFEDEFGEESLDLADRAFEYDAPRELDEQE
jgi:hypothetical protein